MVRFIKVTGLAGETQYLNVDNIFSIYGEMNTYIWHGIDNGTTAVKESKEEIIKMINDES